MTPTSLITCLLADCDLYLVTIKDPTTSEKTGVLANIHTKTVHDTTLKSRYQTYTVKRFICADIVNYRLHVGYILDRIRAEISAKHISRGFSSLVRTRALQHSQDVPILGKTLDLFGYKPLDHLEDIADMYNQEKSITLKSQRLLDQISV